MDAALGQFADMHKGTVALLLGIQHPEQIKDYTISSVDYTDHLWITYTRPEGSLLPSSRSYRFPRLQKSLPATKNRRQKKKFYRWL